tara:strand:- start:1753 stop:2034 length:282 start_codon:yes stop_codon:yes gene_type:complete
MIRSFKSREAERIWRGEASKKLPADIQHVVRRKLRMLDNASTLDDLRNPSANRLATLKGKRAGQHSIRINQQWRLCFIWNDGQIDSVEIIDYH